MIQQAYIDDFIAEKTRHEQLISQCMDLAEQARSKGDVPVGAIVLGADGKVLAKACNDREYNSNPLGHAELNAIKMACEKQGTKVLAGASLYVNLEPCTMCASAIAQCRISKVYFGAWDSKAGGCGGNYDLIRDSALGSCPEVYGGICQTQCQAQLQEFFASLR